MSLAEAMKNVLRLIDWKKTRRLKDRRDSKRKILILINKALTKKATLNKNK